MTIVKSSEHHGYGGYTQRSSGKKYLIISFLKHLGLFHKRAQSEE